MLTKFKLNCSCKFKVKGQTSKLMLRGCVAFKFLIFARFPPTSMAALPWEGLKFGCMGEVNFEPP